ncbi:MAG TPA: rhodanese-like domain-containing protein [Candidatus Sulfotelmatobacter sp.]|nr:rhodanese-like domain-containing protein [Candidatus Sulfotelmatobacter sp.]
MVPIRSRRAWRRRLLLLPVAALLAMPMPAVAQSAATTNVATVAPADAYAAAKGGRTLLIDTRESDEKSAGVPAGVGADVTYRMGGRDDAEFVNRVLKLVDGKRDANITLICRSGVRSAAAERVLQKNGFTSVQSIAGGYNGWREQHLPSQPAK